MSAVESKQGIRSNLFPIDKASEMLDIKIPTLRSKTEIYRKYLHKGNWGRNSTQFDVYGFLKERDLKQELVEKTTLFIEYLVHIEDISYLSISRSTGINRNRVNELKINYKNALIICRFFRDFKKPEWIRFHKYYGWKV